MQSNGVRIIVGGERYEYRDGVLHKAAPSAIVVCPDGPISDVYIFPERRRPTRRDWMRLLISVSLLLIVLAVTFGWWVWR